MNKQPIGIIDSGVGGLTIWKEIVTQLPHESTLYIADSLHAPYGNRSEDEIYSLSRRLIDFLVKENAKIVVVACNTITVVCLEKLRREFKNIPLVGTVPVVKTASEQSRTRRIGIFSTTTTSKSQYQRDLINRFARDCEVITVGTDKLVPLIEKGAVNNQEVEKVLKEALEPFMHSGIDTLALGCSHFPLVKDQIQHIVGRNVKILDSGGAIARQVQRVLQSRNSLSDNEKSTHQVFTTGNKHYITTILTKLGRVSKVESITI